MNIRSLKHYPPYYESYFRLLGDADLTIGLQDRIPVIEDFYAQIPNEKWHYQYAKGKWSVAKLTQHIIDAEMIFLYRAVSIVRGEQQPLIGWSENEYSDSIDDTLLDKDSTLQRLSLLTRLTLNYFLSFTDNDLKKIGNANGYDTEVAAIGYAIIAHEAHHRRVLQERYL